MRLVVILFAEARELLPRENALYHESYGLNGLLERLQRDAAHGAAMAESYGAWPRALALFRLVWEGSHFPDLPVTQYGGELFAPATDGVDGLTRALTVYETGCFETTAMSDQDVYEALRLLTRTTVRIRQGRSSIRAAAPVDFSDLSSEYIGVLYEGLLDYELKTASPSDPVIFLAAGDHPALPLSRLEGMDDRALKALFENLKDTSKAAEDTDEDDGAVDAEAGQDMGLGELLNDDESPSEIHDDETPYLADALEERQRSRTRAETWARHAAHVAGLVRKPRGKAHVEAFENQLRDKAHKLVSRVVLPGEWYLVRWGGTRKGRGTFHTRPGLAIPTVQRTLRPLAFNPPLVQGKPDTDAPPARWTPKLPEEILRLTVCDPACGSGTFPLAALRFLTDALYDSLQHHGRIEPDGQRAMVRLLGIGNKGDAEADSLTDELIPCRPDDDEFEPRLKAVLRRHVVERCIYAVDIDPLAVELCRLSLWIETMDRSLPFGFLDHKIKCGNSLIGAWFDQFRHYPAMASKNREGGDTGHTNGVHFEKAARTKALRAFVEEKLKPDLKSFLQRADLFREDLLEKSATTHQDAMAILANIHALPVQDANTRRNLYREKFLGSPEWRSLKNAMDLWCACWFWPADHIHLAPLPTKFAEPPAETRAVAERIAREIRFFHWELEFPDVFREMGAGFDAVVGNPPWENLQANPEEFFSNRDPLFRSYGRLEKFNRQKEMFRSDPMFEKSWVDYVATFNNLSHWIAVCHRPFGDGAGESGMTFPLGKGHKSLHDRWRHARVQSLVYADDNHPFRHQTGRLFTYKLFLEQSLAIMKHGARCGIIVPSGIYSDAWSRPLREILLRSCSWEWLFGFENREGIFPIHRSYKYNPIIFAKGGLTSVLKTSFMNRDLDDWERAHKLTMPYTIKEIEAFSPRSLAILEIRSERDLMLFKKIYHNSVLLGDDDENSWAIRYKLEFMMNANAKLFSPTPQWKTKGYRPDEYGRWLQGDWRPISELWKELTAGAEMPDQLDFELSEWLCATTDAERRDAKAQSLLGHWLKRGDVSRTNCRLRCAQTPYDNLLVPRADLPAGVVLSRDGDTWTREEQITDVALPFYEGRMIGQFDFSQKGWVSGKGRGAIWRDIRWEDKQIEPQYLMAATDYSRVNDYPIEPKVMYMRVSSATNSRTAIASVGYGMPAGDTAASLYAGDLFDILTLTGILNSLVFDFITRARLSGLHLDYHVLEQNPLPKKVDNLRLHQVVAEIAQRLSFTSPWFAQLHLRTPLGHEGPAKHAAVTESERMRLVCVLNALVAVMYHMDHQDVLRVIDGCDLPRARISGLDQKGFWRIDKDKDPELRLTVLTLVAFQDLEAKIHAARGNLKHGIEAFLTQHQGDGWMLPETIRLADYGLGHDDRANQPQPVASRLGPRFYDWQLVQSADESRRECHLHARNLLGAHGYAMLLVELIERRVANSRAHFDLLTDSFTHKLAGQDGYVTILLEIRARKVLYDDAYWTLVVDLRNNGLLDQNGYGELLVKLHARRLLDELEYSRRGGRDAPAPKDEPLPKVAEQESDYDATHDSEDGQKDLFE